MLNIAFNVTKHSQCTLHNETMTDFKAYSSIIRNELTLSELRCAFISPSRT